ncbi:hypothetical protein KJ644_00300 [Candidatus Dependentiae bacterium]|nr:hypothetical protein [Candidatus Dependentiae bacterium]MBU4386900.1 hypothetical protein [Candidatus Dependentiae bacterium]MCG2756376.1 hypothetical protein [Candidatus Dependentiae bacterium]
MQTKEIGFVLKRFLPNKNKLSVLTKESGKIEIITRPTAKTIELWPGMLLSFYKENFANNSKIFIAQDLEILMSPDFDTNLNIKWAHQILEICYYFAPLSNPDKELFDHIYSCFNIMLLNRNFSSELEIIKKIYLIKLLELLGFYPTTDLITYLSLYINIRSTYINIVDNNQLKLLKTNLQNINNAQISKIDKWIIASLATHPNFKFFRTICA